MIVERSFLTHLKDGFMTRKDVADLVLNRLELCKSRGGDREFIGASRLARLILSNLADGANPHDQDCLDDARHCITQGDFPGAKELVGKLYDC